MKIISKYIAQEFIKYFTLLLAAFVTIIIIGNLFSRLGNVFSGIEQFLQFLKEITLLLPVLLELILPMTVLLATIATFSSLNRTSEIVAMRTAGMSFFQLAHPILGVALLIAGFSYVNQNYFYTWLQELWSPGKTTETLSALWEVDNENIYYLGSRSLPPLIKEITIFNWTLSPYRLLQRTVIETGEQQKDSWYFGNVSQRRFHPEKIVFEEKTDVVTKLQDFPLISFDPPINPHHYPLWSLYQLSKRRQQAGHDATQHWVEFHQKIAAPFALLIMVLIGLALSLSHSRQGKAAEGMALSFLFGVLFWITNQIFLAVGSAGAISPFLAAWLTNFIFLGLAVGLVKLYHG